MCLLADATDQEGAENLHPYCVADKMSQTDALSYLAVSMWFTGQAPNVQFMDGKKPLSNGKSQNKAQLTAHIEGEHPELSSKKMVPHDFDGYHTYTQEHAAKLRLVALFRNIAMCATLEDAKAVKHTVRHVCCAL